MPRQSTVPLSLTRISAQCSVMQTIQVSFFRGADWWTCYTRVLHLLNEVFSQLSQMFACQNAVEVNNLVNVAESGPFALPRALNSLTASIVTINPIVSCHLR